MRILFLSTWFPYPPDDGSRIRAYNLLKSLASHHEITLLSFILPHRDKPSAPELRKLCREVIVVPRRVFKPKGARAIAGFFSLTPRSIVATYSREMEKAVAQQMQNSRYDVVVASEMGTAPYAARLDGLPKVLDEVQVSVIREQFLGQRSRLMKLRYGLTWFKLQYFMRRLLRRFDACTVASEREAGNLEGLVSPPCRIAVIPNGVDVEHHSVALADPVPNTLIFTGVLNYFANYEAMQFFLGHIYPLIQKQLPDVSLKITGRTEGIPIEKLPVREGVTYTGYVDDIRPYVAGSWACIVPLRVGGGTRLKILEAMALGTPVVSTSKGAEGLEVTDGENILIADGPQAFAEATLRLLRDPQLRRRLSTNGRKLVEEKYDWRMIVESFDSLLNSLLTENGQGQVP